MYRHSCRPKATVVNAGTTAERVYDSLKRSLATGSFAPGARLEPARLALELSSSATPIRDALNRLAGERLIETRASEGFHVPALNEIGLRDLYRWNEVLARTALRMSRRLEPPGGDHVAPIDAADLFASIAASSGSGEIVSQVASANARLAYVRQVESNILDGAADEIGGIATAFRQRSISTRMLIQQYHKARLAIVPTIINVLFQKAR
jgi:hypothetical protein